MVVTISKVKQLAVVPAKEPTKKETPRKEPLRKEIPKKEVPPEPPREPIDPQPTPDVKLVHNSIGMRFAQFRRASL